SSGVRTSVRNNATAYGFSVTLTSSFGLISTTHTTNDLGLHVLMFAAGAAAAFVLVELLASRLFRQVSGNERERVVVIGGAIDVVSILAAVATAIALVRIPGTAAWPLTGAGVTIVFLLVGGLDVFIARRA